MSGISMYYNHYQVEGRYSPKEPQVPIWKKEYQVIDNQIKSQNNNPQDDLYKAYVRLEEVYYAVGVSNRAKYSTVSEVYAGLHEKYYDSGNYENYSEDQITAMFNNELSMTLYGIPGGYFNDPHLSGDVKVATEKEQKEYNRHMINIQLSNIFKGGGIEDSWLKNSQMKFTINPFDYTLKVAGVENPEIVQIIERVLNENNNARELFYHIMKNDSGSISEDVRLKYRVMTSFKNITGEDIRTYKHTEQGLVNSSGQQALQVYRDALATTKEVPSRYKGVALQEFQENLEKFQKKDIESIPDMYLSIGYKAGELYDINQENIMVAKFDAKG